MSHGSSPAGINGWVLPLQNPGLCVSAPVPQRSGASAHPVERRWIPAPPVSNEADRRPGVVRAEGKAPLAEQLHMPGAVEREITHSWVPNPDKQRAGQHPRGGPGQMHSRVPIRHHHQARAVKAGSDAAEDIRVAGLPPRPRVRAQPACPPVPGGGRKHRSVRSCQAKQVGGARWVGRRRWRRAGGWRLKCESRGHPDRDRCGCDVAERLAYQRGH